MAVTCDADMGKLWVKRGQWNEDDWWPGISTPLMHRSCQVDVRLGSMTPQSSDFLLIWDLKLNWKVPSWD